MTLTIGSVFSGIGGMELGLERAGLGPVLWQIERDPFCRRVLAKHWPDVLRFSDVREVFTPPPVSILCGGFPCQDLSDSEGVGLAGDRSGLWFEMLRLARDVRPRFVVVENVSNLAVRGVDRVVSGLADLGYDALWFPVRASDVGAPHSRRRLLLVAYADRDRQHAEQAAGLHVRGPRRHDAHGRRDLIPGPRDDARAWAAYRGAGGPEPGILRGANGFPSELDRRRLSALGNACMPEVAEVAGWVVRALAGQGESAC